MTIHVTITEAEKRLAELVAAAVRGETVLLSEAEGPKVRLVPEPRKAELTSEERERIRQKRLSAFGMFKHLVTDPDVEIGPSMTDEELEERWQRKFGPAS